jgi:hypothetical protein
MIPPDPESARTRKRRIWAHVLANPMDTPMEILIELKLTVSLDQIVRDVSYNRKAQRAWKGHHDEPS